MKIGGWILLGFAALLTIASFLMWYSLSTRGAAHAGQAREMADGAALMLLFAVFLAVPGVVLRTVAWKRERDAQEEDHIAPAALRAYRAEGVARVHQLSEQLGMPVSRVVQAINRAKQRGTLPADLGIEYA